MIIVSITGPTITDALRQMSSSVRYADMFEFRLDLLREPFMSRLFAAARKPAIATLRSREEGGTFDGTDEMKMDVLVSAAFSGAAFVDVELACGKEFVALLRRRLGKTKIILSYHGRENINAAGVFNRMKKCGGDIFKLAYAARDCADIRHAVRFLDMAKRERRKAMAIAMGEWGEPSRILYRALGGWATYAAPDDAAGAAPGQISVRVMKQLYRADKHSSHTRIFGVVGNPVAHSKGIYLHNPLFRRMRRDAVYCRFPVKNVARFMQHVAPKLSGFSVTLPHKQRMMRFLHRVDATARSIGAVNTVVRRSGQLLGTNTDAPGALDAIEETVRVKGKRLLVAGAGGAARAIAFEAKRRGATVGVTNRTMAKARALAREFRIRAVEPGAIRPHDWDILVNATAVGMTPNVNASPFPPSLLKGKVVFDAVYNPPMTKLLRQAKRAGARIVQGTEMYIYQAALQVRLYTGVMPGKTLMKGILQIQ